MSPNQTLQNPSKKQSNPTSGPSSNELHTQRILSRKAFERTAIKSLSGELTHKLDLGEAVDVVNKYLWEILDYSVASYIIYNIGEARFESRAYLKESVNSSFLVKMKDDVLKYIQDHSEETVVGSVASSRNIDSLLFGVKVDEKATIQEPQSKFFIPLKVGGKMVGVLYIASMKPDLYTDDDRELIELMITIASVSVARIQTLIQSLHSRTESLVQSLSEGVIMFNLNREVTVANVSAMKFTGLPKEGYNLDEFLNLFPNLNFEENIDKALKEDQVIHIEKSKLSRFYYEIFIVPVKDFQNKTIGGAIILHDITHVVEVDQMKTDFLSVAAHQLRTPLGSMRWNLELIKSQDVGKLDQAVSEVLDSVYESNIRLIGLVNDLLNVSRINQKRVMDDPKDTDVLQIINAAINELKPQATEKNINISVETTLKKLIIHLDPRRFREIMQNLISNSIKYGKIDGYIKVTAIQKGSFIGISVKDNGIGIPQEDQNRIHTKFFRAKNAAQSDTQGSGLGLFVVESYINSWGGKTDFVSSEGEGTTFMFAIPKIPLNHKLDANLENNPHTSG